MFRALISKRRSAGQSRQVRPASRFFEPLEDRMLMSTYSVTNLLDHGAGSLRQAVLNANAQAGTDTITFGKSLHGAITLTSGELDLNDSVNIQGPGAGVLAVSGNNASRVFSITPSKASVSISGLTMTKGSAGAGSGGAVLNFGKLTLTGDVISNSVSASYAGFGGGYGGGGLENFGTVSVSKCTFQNNGAYAHDDTLLDGGGAIYNRGTMTISQTTINNNTAVKSPKAPVPTGPGAINFGGNGGAVYNAGTLTLLDSTIYGNSADVWSGGVFNNDPAPFAVSTIINCTIAGNVGSFSGGLTAYSGTVLFGNSIIATNNPSADGGNIDIDRELPGHLVSLGDNLIGYYIAGYLGGVLTSTDIVGTDTWDFVNPKIGPLAYNGGPTKTMAINASSPACNAGSNELAFIWHLSQDQRGNPRVNHGSVDIGAFEF